MSSGSDWRLFWQDLVCQLSRHASSHYHCGVLFFFVQPGLRGREHGAAQGESRLRDQHVRRAYRDRDGVRERAGEPGPSRDRRLVVKSRIAPISVAPLTGVGAWVGDWAGDEFHNYFLRNCLIRTHASVFGMFTNETTRWNRFFCLPNTLSL